VVAAGVQSIEHGYGLNQLAGPAAVVAGGIRLR
jgi:hypothetical protein